jgi:hypothetical protein
LPASEPITDVPRPDAEPVGQACVVVALAFLETACCGA